MRSLFLLALVACSPDEPTPTSPPVPVCTEPTVEVCDGRDNDCDGVIDEGVGERVFRDRDADGFGDPAAPLLTCTPPAGWVADGNDCDDRQALVFPGGIELCNGIDDDCDGLVDDAPTDGLIGYTDADQDGLGDVQLPALVCELVPGTTAASGDCDDNDALVGLPAALDYADADGDGFASTVVCPAAVVNASPSDCDDALAAVNPGASEIPVNGIDDDCDGLEACWSDGDLDGFGTAPPVQIADLSCTLPGTSTRDDDCDDSRMRAYPGAPELCANDHDDDCNPLTPDVPLPSGTFTYVEVTAAAGLDDPAVARPTTCPMDDSGRPAIGDIDQDGDLDVFMPRVGAPDRLWLNDGAGRFTDARDAWGLPPGASSQRAVLFDLDSDGDLDLFVASSGEQAHALYRSEEGRFVDVSLESGLGDLPRGCASTRSLAVLDVDGDLDLDLHVLGDVSTLYRNDGFGVFRAESAVGSNAEDVQWADLDADGAPEAIVTSATGTTVWENAGVDGLLSWFTTTTPSVGSAVVQRSPGADLDLVVFGATPRVHTPPTFIDVPLAWGLPNGAVSATAFDADLDGSLQLAVHGPDARLFDLDGTDRSCATGSLARFDTLAQIPFDADGDLDLDLLQVAADGTLRLLRADGPVPPSVRLSLHDTSPNRAGLGATLRVQATGADAIHQVLSVDRGQPAQIWLGASGPVDVTVTWPDGAQTEHRGVSGDDVLERVP